MTNWPSVCRFRPRPASAMSRSNPISERSRHRSRALPLCNAPLGRFDTRMILLRHQKFFVSIGQLRHGLLCSGLRETQIRDQLRQFILILRRMESAIKGETFNSVGEALLNGLCCCHRNLRITLIAFHQIAMNDEPGRIFEHQNLSSELNGFTRLAAFVELRVRLKHAEQFVAVAGTVSPSSTRRRAVSITRSVRAMKACSVCGPKMSSSVAFGRNMATHNSRARSVICSAFCRSSPYGTFIRAT
jgi:hypothetical protein